MSKNEDDAVSGKSEQADGTQLNNGEMEPKYARSERLDRPTEQLPEPRAQGGQPVTTVVVRQKTPRAVWVAVIAVIVLLLVVIIVLLLRPTGGGEAVTTTPTPTSTSTSSSRPVPTSLPSTSAATTSQPTTSASTAPAGGGGSVPSPVTLTYASYVDLDNMYPSTTASGQDEIWIGQDGITFNTTGSWAKTRVVLVPTNAVSKQACDTSTVLATGGSLDKKDVGPDQSICVSTSGGKWVVLTSQDHKFSSDDPAYYNQYTFATQVFPGPQPT